MLDGPRGRARAFVARLRQVDRRKRRELRRWLEHTSNLVHVSILVFVPALVGLVTYLSNALQAASFLVFPPLASGTYTLFADPEGQYASAPKFVGGMTIGALSGWVALDLSAMYWYTVPAGQFQVHAGAAALGILLTGVVTWALDLEEPTSFSTALLVLLFAGRRSVPVIGMEVPSGLLYALGIAASSTVVAVAFVVWREAFYERRARYLYETTRGDDHVLVPMRGEHASTVAMFGARIAAAHDAGKVVLLDVVEDDDVAAAEQAALERLVGVDTTAVTSTPDERPDDAPLDDGAAGDDSTEGEAPADVDDATNEQRAAARETAEREVAADSVRRLEQQATRIETKAGVPCDVVVATDGGNAAGVVQATADETNCDLVVVPYEDERGSLSGFVQSLFAGERDVVALRATGDHESWKRVLVPVRKAGDQAHAMIDFALRLAGRSGQVAVCTCISGPRHRRRAEDMLAKLVETFAGRFETRVADAEVTEFIEDNAPHHDLTVIGASTDRSRASRFIARPTFERVSEVDCDVAIVHRGQ